LKIIVKMALTKQERRYRIRKRIRKNIQGTSELPRMSVFRSNKQIYVQLIDDDTGITLASASSKNKEIAEKKNVSKSEQAKLVGKLIAEKCIAKGIKNVVFDRGGYLYHGRVKELAEGAREGGLKF
jgi:large subunit ribosomal protein L18